MMKLSIVIPAFNERATIERVLCTVASALPSVQKEIIVVDDGSTDGTRDWLSANLSDNNSEFLLQRRAEHGDRASFAVHLHAQNRGKGAALRTGFDACSGDVIVIQDADLEYDPADWTLMWSLIAERTVADVVYGSRFYGRPHRSLNFHHFIGNKLISWLFNILYNQTLTDIEVCYKMFRREVIQDARLRSNDFGIEIELSAVIAKAKRWRIYELGISYYGRSYDEGKKINWVDGVKALFYIFLFRVT
jgi:glycosyltransferase involved in cell wall biosynthesis